MLASRALAAAARPSAHWLRAFSSKPAPATVAVVGAGKDLSKAALALIASGKMLGSSQPVSLSVHGVDASVVKELEGGSYPLLAGVSSARSADAALQGASYAMLLAGDFAALGKALAKASPGVLVAVAGNTNALIACKASGLPEAQFSSVSRHTQLLAEQSLAASSGVEPAAVEHVIAWGNGIADISHAIVGGTWALSKGAEPLASVGEASATVAAEALVTHMRDWALGSDGKWVSMGVPAIGEYGTGSGIFYSVPVVCKPGKYLRVGGVHLAPAVAAKMEEARVALVNEKTKAGL